MPPSLPPAAAAASFPLRISVTGDVGFGGVASDENEQEDRCGSKMTQFISTDRRREAERGEGIERETTVQLSEIRSQNDREKKHHRNSSHRQRRNSSQVLSDGSENGEQSTDMSKKS